MMPVERLFAWIRWGGLLAALASTSVSQFEETFSKGGVRQPWWVITWIAVLAGTGLFLVATRDFPRLHPGRRRLLVGQVVLSILTGSDYGILAAICIPLAVPSGRRVPWLAFLAVCITVGLVLPVVRVWPQISAATPAIRWTDIVAVVGGGLLSVLAWCALAYGASLLIVQMDADRRRLAALNAELAGSRFLLAESSRLAERLEISRELHDSLGHHLTTLNLELEIAAHAPVEEKDEQVRKAQFLARLLLADLRGTVSSWRKESVMALPEALQCLAAQVSGIAVRVDLASRLPEIPSAYSHALLRCCQEAITNAIRHGAASSLSVTLRETGGVLELTALDDGPGSAVIVPGNGLSGIAERARELGGSAEFQSPPGGGFLVMVKLPLGVSGA